VTVGDSALGRLQRDVEALALRLRDLENLDTRAMRELLEDIRNLQQKVERIDSQGSTAAEKDIQSIARTLRRHEKDIGEKASASLVQEMRDDTKSNRRIVLAAVVGTAFSIGAWLIQWLISKGHP
jgi:DNA repair exonuclease SbcCD ATPase subunit